MSETTANGRRASLANSAAARKTKSPPKADNAFEWIPLGLIDEPARAMRDTMDEVALAELAESISKIGVVEPLVIERAEHGRYRVIAGHRRLIACQIIKLDPVPCLVRNPGEVDPAAVTVAENYYRENVNAVEEAAFLDKLLTEKCGGDVDVLAALIRHRREYVEDRLLLLRGSTEVLTALREQKISLAVARELNKFKDQARVALYLDAAIRGGATANVVRTWRAEADQLPPLAPDTAAAAPGDPQYQAPAAEVKLRCMFCDETEDPHLMENRWIHRHCQRFLTRILERSSEPASEGKG